MEFYVQVVGTCLNKKCQWFIEEKVVLCMYNFYSTQAKYVIFQQ